MIANLLATALEHHRAGRLVEAEALYRRVLDSDETEVNALHLLGLVLRRSGRLEDGLALIGRALRLNPEFLEARLNRANILGEAGRAAEAAAEWRRLVLLAPAWATAWHGLGGALDRQGSAKLAEAVAALRRAVRLQPGTGQLHHDLGLALRHAARLDEAIASQRNAVAVEPGLVPAQMNLGSALLERGGESEAAVALQRASALAPDSAECWYNLGHAHHGAGDLAGAALAYKRSADAGLGIAVTRFARALADLGRQDEAERVLLDSLGAPGVPVPETLELLAQILLRHNRLGEARALFHKLAETPLAGVRHLGECLTALAAVDLAEGDPHAASARLAQVQGDHGWFFTVKSLAALQTSLADTGLRLRRPAAGRPRPRITSSTLANRGRFAHNALEYVLLRLYAEQFGYVLETPDWVGGAFFDINDPPQSGPLPPLLFPRHRLNDWITGRAADPPLADRDLLSPLFLFEHKEIYRERVQSWLKPRPVWAPWLDPAVERLRAGGSTVVAIHIRRGDFVTFGYPITETDWYLAWLREIWPRIERPVLYLASDDLAAVRGAFAEFRPLVRADVAPDWPGLDYLQDFHVLTQADIVGISAASGFSQLAARLNRRARLFVEPDVETRRIRAFKPWS
ncbi:tetratricopeptide repeat protein [Azospirillum sp. A1-3]|uniref:tetratricopeptide repeat protein n=1 Tax=Azospirillum sp. A1-3 TaxID=185874 RepID=UPI0020774047|nr:tetratricopeptide repeat protein [Azospirillum sp. A1-3]